MNAQEALAKIREDREAAAKTLFSVPAPLVAELAASRLVLAEALVRLIDHSISDYGKHQPWCVGCKADKELIRAAGGTE